jgi:hypothetical protein
MAGILALIVHFQLAHPDASPEDGKRYLLSDVVGAQIDEMVGRWTRKEKVLKEKVPRKRAVGGS